MTAPPLPDQPLKVLEIGTQLGMGGITRHILSLTAWLRAQGHSVTIAGTADVWCGPATEPTFLDLPTRYVAGDGGGLPRRLLHLATAVLRLRRWLKTNRPDLIHTHESAPALVASLARRGLGIPLAVTYHGAEPSRIAAFGGIARRCDLVITPSHHSAADLATIGGVPRDKLRVIGLGVAPAPTDSAEAVAALRRDLLGDGDRVILMLARMVHQKGIDVLIECVAQMKHSHPGLRFAVGGDGPQLAEMQALARQKTVERQLRFLGRIERPHLYLRAADLFLLTSRWEALPFTIVEAFQAGTPAVATACSGVVELIDDTVGRVAPIGDIPAICTAVETVLADEPRRKAMSAAALARAQEDRFNPDWVHPQFEQLYQSLRRPAGA